ncbi:MAG TPA: AAA family ATPase [Acidimicrobiales bacterium]|nr:AAA family ATPase [Acidimicrobiales bacterium]
MGYIGGGTLYDRKVELDVIAEVLEGARDGRGSVTLVEGAGGIGKTRLLQEARRLARTVGLRPMTARCAELERDFAYGVVRQLFEPVVASIPAEQRTSVLSGAARSVAALVTAGSDTRRDDEPWKPDTMMATLNGLYWLTSNLAEREPLLLVVDDAHWGDNASLRFIDFLARRIEELPVSVLLAVRWTEAADTLCLLTGVATEAATRTVRLHPLTDAAVRSFVAEGLCGEPDAPFVAACHKVTGGNPFLLGELVSELSERRIPPVAGNVDEVLRLGPPSVARALELRLARMPVEAGVLARAVAVLGDGPDPAVAAAFCGLSPEDVVRAGDALARCGVFGEDRSLAFRHSIQRAATYAGLSRAERAEGHHRAARLLMDRRAAPEQVAAHLLLSDPQSQPWAVDVLREAAVTALGRGAPEAAATYLHRALAEPPEAAVRGNVLIELCVAEARSPEPSSFDALRLGLELLEDPRKRAEVAVEVARAIGMVADMAAALDLLDRAIGDLGDRDEALSLRLQAEFVTVARLYPASRDTALERLRSLRASATPGNVAGSILLANLALERVEACDLPEAVDLARQALSGGTLLAEERWVFAYPANVLVWADLTDEAERAWTDLFLHAQGRGSITMLHLAAIWRSHLALRCGSVDHAEADARVGLNVCRERAWMFSRSYAVAFLVDALVERAELAAAERVVAENPAPVELHYLLASLGRLRCAQGRLAEGLELFLRCGARLADQGADRNPSVIPWRSCAAVAAAHLGRREQAYRLAGEEVAAAQAFGAPRALGLALRAQALAEEGEAQIERLEEAVSILGRSPARLDEARALGDLGAALRRAGRRSEAETHLRAALELAHSCGGIAVRDRAREELLRSGLRPRRFTSIGVESLTPSERRVADLAVAGLGNREIAQSLFVSLKTVEAHLSSVYRKLGVSARWQLSDVWAGDQEPAGLSR